MERENREYEYMCMCMCARVCVLLFVSVCCDCDCVKTSKSLENWIEIEENYSKSQRTNRNVVHMCGANLTREE